jgi:SpoIID/LytB domain protein
MSVLPVCLTSGALLGAVVLGTPAVGAPLAPGPADATLVVRGHGYGHGHGMSQYGAEGAARQGRSHRQILRFYYPGTRRSVVRGDVRVLITADTTSSVVVSPAAGLAVRDRGTDRTYSLPARASIRRWRLEVSPSGRTVIERLTDQWRRFRHDAGRDGVLVGDGAFKADEALTLWLPDGSTRRYRGSLRAASPSPGAATRDTVNVLSMDRYLRGVIPAEMPATWHPQAVRAQAVAARTYATWSRNQNRAGHYQICDTTSCQVYGGLDAEHPSANAAVRATVREILTYDGRAAFTQFGSSSGGWTASGGFPYLPAKQDRFDGWAGNPVHSWSTTVSTGVLERRYPALGSLRRIAVTHRSGGGDWGGRVDRMVLHGSRSNIAITGDEFRWAYGLRSNWFTLR